MLNINLYITLMVIQAPLMICLSAYMCSMPSDMASLEGVKSYQPKLEESTINLPKVINPIIVVRLDDQNNTKPLWQCCDSMALDAVEIKEPEAPEAFSTEIKFTPDWWPMRGTFNPIGLKIKLNMTL